MKKTIKDLQVFIKSFEHMPKFWIVAWVFLFGSLTDCKVQHHKRDIEEIKRVLRMPQ